MKIPESTFYKTFLAEKDDEQNSLFLFRIGQLPQVVGIPIM